MNKEWIINNLKDANRHIENILSEINKDEYKEPDFRVSLELIYTHLNGVWNGRNLTFDELEKCKDKQSVFRKFPEDLY